MATTKTFLGRIFSWIGDIFHKAEKELVPVILPFIGQLLNGIKAVVESPLTSTAVSFFPGSLPEEIFAKVKAALIKVTEEFNLVHDLATATTQDEVNAALQKVFASVNWPNAIEKQKFLSTFGARVLMEIENNQITFAVAVIDVEYFWENYLNAPTAPVATS